MKKLFLPLVLLAAPMALAATHAPASRYEGPDTTPQGRPDLEWHYEADGSAWSYDPVAGRYYWSDNTPAPAATEPEETTSSGAHAPSVRTPAPTPWIPIGSIVLGGTLLLLFAPRLVRASKPMLRLGGWLP